MSSKKMMRWNNSRRAKNPIKTKINMVNEAFRQKSAQFFFKSPTEDRRVEKLNDRATLRGGSKNEAFVTLWLNNRQRAILSEAACRIFGRHAIGGRNRPGDWRQVPLAFGGPAGQKDQFAQGFILILLRIEKSPVTLFRRPIEEARLSFTRF
ncbi:hypothetical protein [Rhabdaerophilum sp. SD176]|uniref:hypothetical protein n=1 Tax=Rhabdaerophilum sp. SD176 TaxID=2983548 RepID=UPI0024DFD4AD|nr:hypothetical protein [Rhabdaerophilum sp. SD176]